jgi:membrane-associated HD superfamily phosphohydrolase
MLSKLGKSIFLLSLLLICVTLTSAQSQNKNDLPEPIRENLAKMQMKEEEENYKELIKRGEEAAQLSEEISKSYEEHKKLSSDDQKKLEKLEKVVKRIRRDLGAENDDKEEEDKPSSVSYTLNTIKEKTSNLLAELKKASRYSISVVAVESSNRVFKLVRFLRFNKN